YDFKKLTSAYSYLRKNNIETIGQLQTKIETLKSNSYRLNKKEKESIQKQIKKYKDLSKNKDKTKEKGKRKVKEKVKPNKKDMTREI
ncbi:TPA: nickase, partial [Streptococcus pneumoniae]